MTTPTTTSAPSANPYGVQLFPTTTPSGSTLPLQTAEEHQWYEDRRDRYLQDNAFPNVSDLQDLDRLLLLEMMTYRWGLWLAQGFDYLYARVNENDLQDNIKKYSTELRLLKIALGIDKATRDKEKGENLAEYVQKILDRAKEFGYHRNEQYEIVVTKFYALKSMILTYDRCDDEERRLLDLSIENILDWIRTNVVAEMDQHAAAFRKQQAIWVRDL